MRVLWDPRKARANFQKHGVRFSDAEGALFDPNALTVEDPTAEEEQRFVSIGWTLWAASWLSFTRTVVRMCGSFQPVVPPGRRDGSMKREYDFSRGRRGAVIPQTGKTRITIYIDSDVLEEFRRRADSMGRGYQTMINEALREYLGKSSQPLDEKTLRRLLREELRKTG